MGSPAPKEKPAAQGVAYLVEPEKARKRWTHKIPTELKAIHDSVTYRATPLPNQKLSPRGHTLEATACYSDLRPDYSKYEIVCSPHHKGHIDGDRFLRFFEIVMGEGIVPGQAKPYVEDGVIHLRIADETLSSQEIYPALCCYRWADSNPPLVYEFLKLYDSKNRPWNVFQILVHVIAKHCKNCNHSFISTKHYMKASTDWQNPLLGVAAKIFFDPEDERRGSREHVNDAIGEICDDITECRTEERRYGTSDLSAFALREQVDILSPRLVPLYELEKPGKEELQTTLKEIFEEQGK